MAQQIRSDRSERDERQIGDDQIQLRRARVGCVEIPDVCALDDRDPGIDAEALVELSSSHVDGEHGGSAPLEHAVCEAPGRRPRVEHPLARGVEPEQVEGGFQLEATPSHIRRRWGGQQHWLSCRNESRRFSGRSPTDQDLSGLDHPDSLRTAGSEATSNQLGVQPPPRNQSSACPIAVSAAFTKHQGESYPPAGSYRPLGDGAHLTGEVVKLR